LFFHFLPLKLQKYTIFDMIVQFGYTKYPTAISIMLINLDKLNDMNLICAIKM